MRFLLGVLVGYGMRGKEKRLIAVLLIGAIVFYMILPAIALLALHLDVQHERQSRPAHTRVPALKGLSYEKRRNHASHISLEHSTVSDTLQSATPARTAYRSKSTAWRGS
ncbi:MAG: hypothetical protein LC776_10555 [Acidobacteria bacterium]|nr:hypothetical protein [Acidobacteriota bacterium]